MLLRKPEELTPENINNSLVEERGFIIEAKNAYYYNLGSGTIEYSSYAAIKISPDSDLPEVSYDNESKLFRLGFARADCGGYDIEYTSLYFKTLSELLEAIGITKEMLEEELCA